MLRAKLSSRGFTLIASLLLMLLLSGVAVALLMTVNTEQRVGGADLSNSYTYRAAEGGMEKLTSDLASTFKSIQAPTNTEICGSAVAPAWDPSVTYPTYNVAPVPGATTALPCPPLPNPPPWGPVQTGPDAGLYAQILPVTLNVVAQRIDGQENVSMTRTAEVALIPVFQFGVFCNGDCFFGQSPNLGFAGRVHTNGDLYIGVANGSNLVFGDKISAFGNIIREQMDNGVPVGGGTDDGTVMIPTTSNGCATQMAALALGNNPTANATTCVDVSTTALGNTDGSVTGGHASAQFGSWQNVSLGKYNSYIIDGNGTPPNTLDGPNSTGASDLTLPFVQGTTSAVQIIRRPPPGESTSSLLGGSRLANEAQIRILLSDTEDGLHLSDWNGVPSQDVQLVGPLPSSLASAAMLQGADSASPGTQPFKTGAIQVDPTFGAGTGHYYSFGESYCAGTAALATQTIGNPCPTTNGGDSNFVIPPFYGGPSYGGANRNWPPTQFPQWPPQSFPAPTPANFTTANGSTTVATNNTDTDGLEWPLIGGWLLVEVKNNAGTWVGVTNEWLSLGFARGVNAPTQPGSACPAAAYTANTIQVNNGCNALGDHRNAILYFQVTKDSQLAGAPSVTLDHPLTGAAKYYDGSACGNPPLAARCQSQYNWYPINFYDAREGENNDISNNNNYGSFPNHTGTPSGVMNAVELDIGNLRNWLLGVTGSTGNTVNYTAQNGYVLYFSDRRGMQFANVPSPYSQWGEYGYEDTVNYAKSASSFKPDGALDALNYNGVSPEDVNSNGLLDNYGVLGVGDGFGASTTADTDGGFPPASPYAQRLGTGERVLLTTVGIANRVTGARHVLKLVDGSLGQLPTMPPASGCVQSAANPTACGGFTVAAENPVYVVGNYNSNCPTGGGAAAGCTINNAATPVDPMWTNVGGVEPNHAAASVIADAVTVLSNNWQDWGCAGAVSTATFCGQTGSMENPLLPYAENGSTKPSRDAVTTYYRVAVAAGKTIAFNNVAQVPEFAYGTDGGIHNFLRFIEDWFGVNTQQSLYYKGSLVSLYWNNYATGAYKCCNLVYTPPNRQYTFDPLFALPQNLPPGTPMFRNVDNLSYRQNQVARSN